MTPGHVGELSGKRLKFDPARLDEGLFFVPLAGGSEVKVTDFQQNTSTELVFHVPSLSPGTYKLFVRARLFDGTELRSGDLQPELSVA